MMSKPLPKYFYLSGAEKPVFIEKGLYSGLKEKNGLPSPLPITLEATQEYTGTGFLDALPHSFLNETGLQDIIFHANVSGPAVASFYILLTDSKIYHAQDFLLENGTNKIILPKCITHEPNGRLIMFKIKPLKETITLTNWAYLHNAIPQYLQNSPKLKVVSRSLGDSESIIDQFKRLHEEHESIGIDFPDCFIAPFPSLIIYESDKKAYNLSREKIKKESLDFISLKYNQFNLGGGGNMTLAVQKEVIADKSCSQFIMVDSDTSIPFRTLYYSVITAAQQAIQAKSVVTVPTILYTKNPNIILECGALFGRGNWGIASSQPSQPCIAPFHHNRSIMDKNTQSSISTIGYTDYPPFIYSLYNSASIEDKINFLPVPFFLRGDDIEMGLQLQEKNIPSQVHGWLAVFQEPKHSLWHEFMAILHGSCLIFAHNKNTSSRHEAGNFAGLRDYFSSRINCHSQISDLAGLEAYNEVLKRLIEILNWSENEVVKNFHDPSFYLKMRKLNSNFSKANYKTIRVLQENGGYNPVQVGRFPFLYFDGEYRDHIHQHKLKPTSVALINKYDETAQIINLNEVSSSSVQEFRSKIINNLEIVLGNEENLRQKCTLLCNKKLIQDHYLNKYTKKSKQPRSDHPIASSLSMESK